MLLFGRTPPLVDRSPPPTLETTRNKKVAGAFLETRTESDLDKSLEPLRFDANICMFTQVGVSPKDSELQCSAWLCDLISFDLIDLLRNEDIQVLPQATSYLTKLVRATDKVFGGVVAMEPFMNVLASLLVLMEASKDDGPLAHPPSELRRCMRLVVTFPRDSGKQLSLAMSYGKLANHIVGKVTCILAASAQDELADKHIATVKEQVAAFNSQAAPYDAHAIEAALRALDTGVRMYGRCHLEEKAPEVNDILLSFSALFSNRMCSITAGMQSQIMPGFGKLIDFLATASASPAPTAGGDATSEATADSVSVPIADGAGGTDDPTIDAKAASVELETLLKSMETVALCDLADLHSNLELASKVQSHTISALADVSSSLSMAIDLASQVETAAKMSDSARCLHCILKSSRCLLKPASPNYADLLNHWKVWTELQSDAQGEVETPILEEMLRGASEVRALRRILATGLDHDGMTSLMTGVLETRLPQKFDEMVTATLADSMASARAASYSDLLGLTDCKTVKRCSAEGRLANVLNMLLGGSGAGDTAAKQNMLFSTVQKVLQECSGDLKAPFNWPFAAAINMAKNFVLMMGRQDAVEQALWWANWSHSLSQQGGLKSFLGLAAHEYEFPKARFGFRSGSARCRCLWGDRLGIGEQSEGGGISILAGAPHSSASDLFESLVDQPSA